MIKGTNGVEMTRQQHEATHFQSVLGSKGSFIMRLEIFLAEMERRCACECQEKQEPAAMQVKPRVKAPASSSPYGLADA